MLVKKHHEFESKDSDHIVSFYFSAGNFRIYFCLVLVVGVVFYWHGHVSHVQSSLVISLFCMAYLVLDLFFSPKPPKSIHIDLKNSEVFIYNRWPKEIETLKFRDLNRVECFVRPRRFAVTELVFHSIDGSKKTYLYDVETTGSFFSLPKEVPNKEVQEFVFVISNFLNNKEECAYGIKNN